MTTDFRSELQALVSAYDEHGVSWSPHHEDAWFAAVKRARIALAESEPEGPTVMEIIELADEIEEAELGQVDLVRAALARWGRPAPEPVPVSERLPGAELCWWYEPDEDDDGSGYGGSWTLLRIRGNTVSYTHWLPAHALPVPTSDQH